MNKRSILTIGNFDGIHLGHQKLLGRLRDCAQQRNAFSVVLSYTDHPAFTLKAHPAPRVLCPAEYKKRQLLAFGIDKVELLSFSHEFAHISAESFLKEYIVPVWNPELIIVGYDSHFGYQRKGDFHFLQSHTQQFGFDVEYVDPLLSKGRPISSSMIRELLIRGEIDEANRLLGKPYRLLGDVGHGIGKGTSFGFPTANLILGNPHQLIPAEGIYLSKAFVKGSSYFGLTNIGSSPTVKHSGVIEIETFLLDFEEDIYNTALELELHMYLRPEKKFASVEELIMAMKQDLDTARDIIKRGI